MINRKIEALNKFKESYLNLLYEFDEEINDLDSIKLYPFEKSFDEYDVAIWVDESIKEIKRGG